MPEVTPASSTQQTLALLERELRSSIRLLRGGREETPTPRAEQRERMKQTRARQWAGGIPSSNKRKQSATAGLGPQGPAQRDSPSQQRGRAHAQDHVLGYGQPAQTMTQATTTVRRERRHHGGGERRRGEATNATLERRAKSGRGGTAQGPLAFGKPRSHRRRGGARRRYP